ncbi:MAG TPA: hypothetical protein VH413_00075 [Verrucomicrobiae bacterium]|jgi:hypothetical protein|nr:hypothetical protein [Verrucomicrobiae bacterium]
MKQSKKLQREISDFVEKCRQKDAAKAAAHYPPVTGAQVAKYDNSLWAHLFFESSSLKADANRSTRKNAAR